MLENGTSQMVHIYRDPYGECFSTDLSASRPGVCGLSSCRLAVLFANTVRVVPRTQTRPMRAALHGRERQRCCAVDGCFGSDSVFIATGPKQSFGATYSVALSDRRYSTNDMTLLSRSRT